MRIGYPTIYDTHPTSLRTPNVGHHSGTKNTQISSGENPDLETNFGQSESKNANIYNSKAKQ